MTMSGMTDMTVRKIPAEKLLPAVYNPRKDLRPSDPEYKRLLRSINEFGYVDPIVWNERTGNIVSGHQRFQVLKKLGFSEIDCIVVDIDETSEKALNVALNNIRDEFDMPKLADLLSDLEKSGFSVDLTGFEAPDLDEMYRKLARSEGRIVEDGFDGMAEAAKITAPITRPGDVWLLGEHRLMCADPSEYGAVSSLMDGEKAKLIVADPLSEAHGGGQERPIRKSSRTLSDEMMPEQVCEFLHPVIKSMASVCAAGAAAYVFMDAQTSPGVLAAMKTVGFH